MARTSSAQKARRGSLRKQTHNHRQLAVTDRLIRLFRRAETVTAEDWTNVQQALDKAAKNGLYHHGKVDRLKNRLARRLTNPTATRAIIKRVAKKRTNPTKKRPIKK